MTSINSVVSKYQEALSPQISLNFSRRKRTLGREGIPNRLFCIMLCQNQHLFIEFLKETRLIVSELLCEKCNLPMFLQPKTSLSDGFRWICKNKYENKVCGRQKTIRQCSWFHLSRLKMEEIFVLTYEIVRGTETKAIALEYEFSSSTLCDWRMFVNEILFVYVNQIMEKIGGVEKIVEIDVFTLGNKSNRSEEQNQQKLVWGGIERETKKLILIPVPDLEEETLFNIIKDWIEPGTLVYAGCKITESLLGKESFEHLTAVYNISFNNSVRMQDLNSLLCVWGRVKGLLSYNRQVDIKYHLAKYLFEKSCKEKGVDFFVQFLEIIRNINWAQTQPNQKL